MGNLTLDDERDRDLAARALLSGSLDSLDLCGIEDAKIACAREHFAAISGTNITYDTVRER